jgi:hypothetical protein
METVGTKAMMYRLLKAGRFGNYPRSWDSVDAVERDKFTGLVSIRSLEVSNPVKLYHIPGAELRETVEAIPMERRAAGFNFLEAPPDHKRTIQGEWDGTNLFYSCDPQPMRFALAKDGRQVSGVVARTLLRHYLDPGDVDWLDDLVMDFPDHVIEFSGVSIRCGTHNRRMIVWEVRAY